MLPEQFRIWLRSLERRFRWLGIPNIAILFVTLQALGFLMVSMDPVWIERLALFPNRVIQGEYWRLITFLALPLSLSLIWVIFALWFIYFILDAIEREWGDLKTTLYVLLAIVLMIIFSFWFDYPITNVSDFESTLFLAAATLFPELEIRLFLIIPVKMKWLGWLSLAFLGVKFIESDWVGRVYLLMIYFNYLLFFGPAALGRVKQMFRRWNYRRKIR